MPTKGKNQKSIVYCPNCSRRLDHNSQFCEYCGVQLKGPVKHDAPADMIAISRNDFLMIWIAGIITWLILGLFLGLYSIIIALVLIALTLKTDSIEKIQAFMFSLSCFSLVGLIIAWYIGNKRNLTTERLSGLFMAGLFFLSVIVELIIIFI